MTTSADTIYELTGATIVQAAMRKCGALAQGQTPTAEDYTNGTTAVNGLISSLQGTGLTIWKRTEQSVTLVASQRDYTIGIGQTIDSAFPLRIESAVLVTTTGGARQELEILPRSEFNLLNATSEGSPTSITYTPKVNLGVMSIWPMADSTTASAKTIRLLMRTAFEGFAGSTETPDFPQEWANVLIYGTAVLLAPEYGVPLNDRKELKADYAYWLDLAVGATQGEDEIVQFKIDRMR